MHRCGHDNCFTCPFPDCIVGRDYGEPREKKRAEEIKAAKAAYRRKSARKAYADGLCIVYRKEKLENGKKTCEACLQKARAENQKTKLRGITR